MRFVARMRPGDTWKIWIPSAIGYGSKGAGGAIPPDAGLFFELELLEAPLWSLLSKHIEHEGRG